VRALGPVPDPAVLSIAGTESQTIRAQLGLRELILDGGLVAGERLTELSLVDRLGVSRTPVRAALLALQQEGLLESLAGGGIVVKAFNEADIHDAIEVRGTLEGLAVRWAAERGVAPSLLARAAELLARIDGLLARRSFNDAAFNGYVDENARFHELLAEMADSEVLHRQITRACAQPFASPSAFVMTQRTGTQARDRLVLAQDQHHAALEAVSRREGARAEALMREHARIAHRNLGEALASRHGLAGVRGAGLIRRGGRALPPLNRRSS
jgi:GntR family transcriptional regulator, vanillate catabolism transcriptional regulator